MRIFYRLCAVSCFILFSLFPHAQIAVDFSMDQSGGCSPLPVNFTSTASGVSSRAVYSWDFGNGNRSTLQNPSAIYTAEQTYTVTLTVTDGSQTASRSKTITVYKKPVVDFSVANAKICLPAGAQFTSASLPGDGTISSLQWDFGDGTVQQGYGNTISYNYSVEQTATVSLTVTNSFGCQASATKQNIVEILPPINPMFSSDKNMLCALTDSVQFTNTSTGPGPLIYLWEFGDGTTSTATNPAHRYTKKGLYPVKLTVSNSLGCSASAYPIEVNAAYFNTNFENRPLCREVSFTPSSAVYPTGSFWNFGDGNTSNASYNTTHTYATAGTYNVTLINTYGACYDTVTKPVTVKETVNYNSGITMPASVCVGTSVDFTTTSSMAPGYTHWDFGNGGSYNYAYQPTVTHAYNQPGTYTVKMTNVFGTCSETVSKTITVHPLPNPQGFVVDYGGKCGSPVTVKFNDTTTGTVAWQWYMDNSYPTPFSTAKNPSYSFNSDGYHYVTLTVRTAEGCSGSAWKSVNVFRPTAHIGYVSSSSQRGNYDCDSLRIRFVASSNQTIVRYHWDLGNGKTSTEAEPEMFYDKQGIYNILLTYTTESGCSATASYTVRVYGKPKADFTYTVPCDYSLNLQFRDASYFSDNWQWQFGDGTYDDYYSSQPVHSYADTGNYSVRFINHIGRCSDTIVKTVHANLLPSYIYIAKAENTCLGNRGTVTFDHLTLRATNLEWDFGDGTTLATDTSQHNIKHTYAASGTYTVRLTGKYGDCVHTSNITVNVLLKQNPVLSADKTQLCASDNLAIQIKNLQTNPFSNGSQWWQYSVNKIEYNTGEEYAGYYNMYDWNYTSYTATLSHFAAGVSKMRAIINISNTGCTDTTNYINVQVNGPVAKFTVQNTDGCFKSAFVFTDSSRSVTSTPLTSWSWDLGDGNTRFNTTNSTVRHTYANPGIYTVRLRVTDATGCNTSYALNVNARGIKASFTPSGLFIPNVPLNTDVTFYNQSISHNTDPAYLWIYGDGTTGTDFYGSHTYTRPGVNTVQLIVNDASIPCADTAKTVITVKDFNTAFSFTKTFLNAGSCPPVLVQINNLSVGFTSLKWDFGDGTTSTASYYPSHIYNKPGVYKITLYTYGYNGLTGTYVDSVEVKEPAAQISADLFQGCLSQTVKLQAASENAASYLWDFGDGVVSTGNTVPAHAYTTPGLFTPRLVVKDANGCATSAELSKPIVIDSLSVAIQDLPSLLCDSALIHFRSSVNSFAAVSLNTSLRYQWHFGTGRAKDTSDLENPSFRFTRPGIYIVRLKVSSPYGCIKETAATVVIREKAKGRITATQEVCQDGTVQFAATATTTSNVQWSWTFGNGYTASQQNPPAQVFATPGNYPVTLVVTKDGCMDTVNHSLTVHPKPVVNAVPKQAVLCLGNSLTLSAGGGTTYQWSPAAGLSSTAVASPVASPTTTTLYRVVVATEKGCKSTDSVAVTVGQSVKVQLVSATDLCQGESVQLNAGGAAGYQWIGNTAGLSNAAIANPIASPVSTSTYTVVGSDQHNCFKDTTAITITVRNLPTVTAGPDLQLPGNIPYPLAATGSPDVVAWLWSPADDLSCTNCPSPILTPKIEKQYTVTVRNQWGCTARDSLLVKLDCATNHVYFPNAFTPNNDGKNDVFFVAGSGVKIIRHLRIFSRWSSLVFERSNFAINDRSAGWNGLIKGQPAETGTYVYVAELECSSGFSFTRQGTVTVIR